ncbi:cyclic nucleotide-binding domain-containing protein [Mesorhizobium sp. M0045]|uniref:cyclic nucleotide-binding domain-containing protein n=1 Tax=Mesorhizobium sp. M0045 TaxID=2956857 RepID=UPI00333D4867
MYAQGEKAGAFYQVEFGGVRIYRQLADGRRQISVFHLAGETFGFEADTTHHFFAEAINATGVRVIRFATGANISRWRNCYFVDFSNVLESFFGKVALWHQFS